MKPRDLNCTSPVRPGEQIDQNRLERYLREALPELAGPVELEQFASGHSNLTYLVKVRDREVVLRRPPFGSRVRSAHDMGREYRVLSRLYPWYPPAPRPIHYCEDAAVLGAPFYLMERLRGLVIRKEIPPALRHDSTLPGRLSRALIDNLVTLHALDWRGIGLGDFGRPEGYVHRQIEGWTRRWQGAKTRDLPDMETAAVWLAANIPSGNAAALIHNDYKLDNLLLDPDDLTVIRGVLDWEMATVGDPLMDLGTSLSYWMEPTDREELLAVRFSPTEADGFWRREQVVEHYAARSGRDVSAILFYYVYGLFKLAVIIQQIYFRYAQGHTSDERFAGFDRLVAALARQAAAVLERGRITLG